MSGCFELIVGFTALDHQLQTKKQLSHIIIQGVERLITKQNIVEAQKHASLSSSSATSAKHNRNFLNYLFTDARSFDGELNPCKGIFESPWVPAKFSCAKFHIYATVFFFFWSFFCFFGCSKISFRCFLVHHILRRKTWKLPYLDTAFWEVAKT